MEFFGRNIAAVPVRAVLFDFDGTLSTLRCGWENVMRPLMLEMISGGEWEPSLEKEVDEYISESTGIQTIHQMKWLADRVKTEGKNINAPEDPWLYKEEYNRRLMENVQKRLDELKSGRKPREQYLVGGSEEFLKTLHDRGIKLYVASGTDHPDVVNEAAALGLLPYFIHIAGAPVGSENCSKERVIAQLIEDEGLCGNDFAVIGDGKVEIRLGTEAGARTLGLASDEVNRIGINPLKRERLIKAGADAIVGDFCDLKAVLGFLGLEA